MRFRPALLLAPLLVPLLAGDPADAADVPPLVVAVDVTLGVDDRAAAGAAVVELVGALPPDAEIGLIVFDDVVRSVVPLAPADASQLDAFDAALVADLRGVEGNVAVGLERGLDELGDRDGSHLMLFARAQVAGEDEAARTRFADWYRELLLPDAAAGGIAITLVTPPTGADTTLLADIGTHPGNAVVPLETGPDARTTLVSALRRRLTGGDVDAVASADPIDELTTSTEAATLSPEIANGGDIVVATSDTAVASATDARARGSDPDAGDVVTPTTAPSDAAGIVPGESAVVPPDAVTVTRPSSRDRASIVERLRPWLLAAAALLAGLLIVSTIRQRRAERDAGTVSSDTPTIRSANPASVATAARVRTSPRIERARTDVAAREAAAAARTVDRQPSPRASTAPARAETVIARTPDGHRDASPDVSAERTPIGAAGTAGAALADTVRGEPPADATGGSRPAAATGSRPPATGATVPDRPTAARRAPSDDPEITSARATAPGAAPAGDPAVTARREPPGAATADDPTATARRDAPDATSPNDPATTARRETPDAVPTDDPATSGRREPSEGEPTDDPVATARRETRDAAPTSDPIETARREPPDGAPTGDPAATARRDPPDDAAVDDPEATARRERPDDTSEVDELELLGRLTAERHRQGSLDDD